MRLFAAATVAALALLTPPACDTCGPPLRCTYATLLLLVHDGTTGELLPGATVSQSGSPVGIDLTQVTCAGGQCTHAVSPGTGAVTISLSGYQDAVIDFVERGDSCGSAVRQFADVGLQPDTSSTASVVSALADRGSGCN